MPGFAGSGQKCEAKNNKGGIGGALRALKDKQDKDKKEGPEILINSFFSSVRGEFTVYLESLNVNIRGTWAVPLSDK